MRVVGNAHHRIELATAGLLAGVVPIVAVFDVQRGTRRLKALQELACQPARLPVPVGERQRRRIGRVGDLHPLLEDLLLGLAQGQLCRRGPLRRGQPVPCEGIALCLAGTGQGHIQCVGQGLLHRGDGEVQPLRRQVAGAQQHHALQRRARNQRGRDVGIADEDIGLVVFDHLEGRRCIVRDNLARPRVPGPDLRPGEEIALDHHAQIVQVGVARRTQIPRAAYQRQGRFGVGGGRDQAVRAVGVEGDVHHHVDFAAARRIQHGTPVRVLARFNLHA